MDIMSDEMVKALVILNSQAENHSGLTPFYVTAYRKISIKSQFIATISNAESFLESYEFALTTQPQVFDIGVEAGCSHYSPTWNDDSVYTSVRSSHDDIVHTPPIGPLFQGKVQR